MHQTHVQRFATIRRIMPAAAVIVCAGILASSAHAQCETWQPVGNGLSGSAPFSMISSSDDLIVGGLFGGEIGGASINNIGRWDGNAWHPIGGGTNNTVHAVTLHNNQIFIGGSFTSAEGQPANRVARWNGLFWQSMSSGMSGPVLAMTVYNGNVIAGGFFTTAGGVSANRIARWNGAQWLPLGAGFNGGVFALAVHNGELIAAGDFTTADGQPALRIARWNGTNWQPLGSGLNNYVAALHVHDNQLYVGGGFTTAGGQSASGIARWTDTGWQAVGFIGIETEVSAIASYGSDLYVGGYLSSTGSEPMDHLARWDGTAWHPVGGGTDHPVEVLHTHQGALFVGGGFSQAGDEAAYGIARWRVAGTIDAHPQSIVVAPGAAAQLNVTAGNTFAGPFTYQWRKNGQPLQNGGTISGAQSPTLTIMNMTPADFGAYDVEVSNACATILSIPAAISVCADCTAPSCPGDLNDSGAVDVQDLLLLLSNWGVCP